MNSSMRKRLRPRRRAGAVKKKNKLRYPLFPQVRGRQRMVIGEDRQTTDPVASSSPRLLIHVGDTFDDRYTAIKKLGSGTFSVVWMAWDSTGNEFTAIKFIKNQEEFFSRGLKECELLNYIEECPDHPFKERVMRLKAFRLNTSPGVRLFLCFKLMGRDLGQVLGQRGGLGTNAARIITRQLLEGLVYLHDCCGVVHMDLKPENVLLQVGVEQGGKWEEGLLEGLKLSDLGMSFKQGEKDGTEDGTLPYMSPEALLTPAAVSFPTDVWSLGCTAFEAATGWILFSSTDLQVSCNSQDRQDLTEAMEKILSVLCEAPGELLGVNQVLWRELHSATSGSTPFASFQPQSLFDEFLISTLCYDPLDRLTAAQGLAHPWIAMPTPELPK